MPILTAISGHPGVDAGFSLFGSGFMEGASTITIGGLVLDDHYTNTVDGDVVNSRNSQFNLIAPWRSKGRSRSPRPAVR